MCAMKLENPDFNKKAYFKKLESIIYLFLMLPLAGFGWVFLEKESGNALRSVFFEEPDIMFHGVMLIGVGYILMRTVLTWRRDMIKYLDQFEALDVKLKMIQKPLIYRNILWAIGAGICVYGLYEKGDMLYALIFTVFLILITANRPTGHYFAKFFRLKGEKRKWMEE